MEVELLEPVQTSGEGAKGVTVRTSKDVKIFIPDPIKVRVTDERWVMELVITTDPITLTPAIDEVLSIRRRGDRPIPKDILRSLGFGKVFDEVVGRFSMRWERRGNRWVGSVFGGDLSPSEVRKVQANRTQVSDADVKKAADVYRAAVAAGRRDATMAVAEALNASRPTAARRVQKAREMGLLGPIVGTKAGEAR